MSSLVPRAPYSQEELERLYPKGLKLQLVQVLLRHGERSPVNSRFRNAGLAAYWPYCSVAKRMASITMSKPDWPSWDELQWRRRLETFGDDDEPMLAHGPGGELDGICQHGELTDTGRLTTLKLGQRLRHLYVDQLSFMPKLISDADMIYLRASPMPRALESLQQSFWGLYPSTARTASFPPPTIVTRAPVDETLFPNERNCRRFSQLSRAFAQRTADRWNHSTELEYVNKLISKWMPEESPKVAVDSHPRLSGVMDTVNATLAHGPATRLPKEFYNPKSRKIIDEIAVEEWFSGYRESQEYRQVGIGALVGDIVGRMLGSVEHNGRHGVQEAGIDATAGRAGEKNIKFAMSGCHDTTLAAVLTSLGAFEGESWPSYTSHLAVELFQKPEATAQTSGLVAPKHPSGHFGGPSTLRNKINEKQDSWSSMFWTSHSKIRGGAPKPEPKGRKRVDEFTPAEKGALENYYVRLRYNDKIMTVPGCKAPGNHLEGDESFCTLEAFKRIADKFTPQSWKEACASNLDQPAFPRETEKAGY